MDSRWPMIGRDAALESVVKTLAGADHNGVIIGGGAGVGKTRLAREAAAALATDGWTVRRVTGTRFGQSVMMGAFAQWTDGVGSSPLTPLRRVVAALSEEARGAPMLVFADDAHLLDDLSALVLHQLVVQQVAAVVATVRTGEPVPDTVMQLWKNDLLDRLELPPLSREDSDRLMRTVLPPAVSDECLDRMWDLTRGNALFLRHLVDQERSSNRLVYRAGEWRCLEKTVVAPLLAELVELQIGAVPDDVREVVDLVAVAEPLSWSCLTSLADTQSVETAAQRGLIEVSPDTDMVYVGHPLYAEIRLEHCGPRRARQLRGAAATALVREHKKSHVDPIRLGLLWMESDLEPDPGVLSAAAQCARSRLNLVLAERFARAAADVSANPLTLMSLAYILFLLEKGAETEQVLDALDATEAPGGFVNTVVLRAANRLWVMRQPEQSREIISAALLRCGDADSNGLRTFRGVQLALAARPTEAIAAMAAVDYGQLDPFGQVLGLCAEVLALGDLGRVGQAVERAAAGYAVIDGAPHDSFGGTGLAEFHANALLAAGHVDAALTVAEDRYRKCAEEPGLTRSMALAAAGMAALAKGDLVSARERLESAAAGIGGYGDISGIFYRFRIVRTEVLARAGQLDAAVAELELTRRSRHPAYVCVESAYLIAAAWVSAVQGRAAEAREMTCRAAEFARSHGQWAREVMCLQTATQFGDVTGAGRLAELTELVEGPRVRVVADYARAVGARDAEGLEAASGNFEDIGDVLAAADAAAQAAAVHRLSGKRGSALSVGTRAQQLARACGGAVSPALTAARIAFPFTQREHDVVILVAQGLSNREIAAALSLSVRTVEGHIYRAGVKAGAATRSQLSALVGSPDQHLHR